MIKDLSFICNMSCVFTTVMNLRWKECQLVNLRNKYKVKLPYGTKQEPTYSPNYQNHSSVDNFQLQDFHEPKNMVRKQLMLNYLSNHTLDINILHDQH